MWWEAVKTGCDSGCTAASVGYPRRIRKGVIHSPRHTAVMESVSSNKNLAACRSRRAARMPAAAQGRGHDRRIRDRDRMECGRGALIMRLFSTLAVVILSDLDSVL